MSKRLNFLNSLNTLATKSLAGAIYNAVSFHVLVSIDPLSSDKPTHKEDLNLKFHKPV